jgi:hypothetical protein
MEHVKIDLPAATKWCFLRFQYPFLVWFDDSTPISRTIPRSWTVSNWKRGDRIPQAAFECVLDNRDYGPFLVRIVRPFLFQLGPN